MAEIDVAKHPKSGRQATEDGAAQIGRRAARIAPELVAACALVLPGLLFLSLLFFYPIGALFIESVPNGSLEHYQKIITSPVYTGVFLKTLKIAAIVTIIDLVIAYPLAFYVSRLSPSGKVTAFFLILLPLWTSQLVRTYAWMVLLGRQGPINSILIMTGLLDQPVRLLNTEFAVVIGMVHILLPFMVLPLYSAVDRIDRSLPEAAYGLGASRFQLTIRILLPLALQGALAGTALVFVLSVGVFIMPALLGGGRVPVVPLLIEQQTTSFLNWSFSGALSAILLVVVLLVFWMLNIVVTRLLGTRRNA